MNRFAVGVVALLLTVTNCSNGSESPRLEAGPIMAVALAQAGDDPALLRYRATEGQVGRLEMVMTIGLRQTIDGDRMPTVAIPDLRAAMVMTVEHVDPDGTFTVGFTFEEYEAVTGGDTDAAVVEAVQVELDKLVGLTGRLTMTDRGIVEEASIASPDGLDPTIQQVLDQFESQIATLSVPLPEEPVGTGGSWDGAIELEIMGLSFDVLYEFTVVKIQGNRVVVEVSYRQTVHKGPVELPGLPSEIEVAVESGEVLGEGRQVMDLSQVVPTEALVDADGAIRMVTTGEGERAVLDQDMELGLRLTRL